MGNRPNDPRHTEVHQLIQRSGVLVVGFQDYSPSGYPLGSLALYDIRGSPREVATFRHAFGDPIRRLAHISRGTISVCGTAGRVSLFDVDKGEIVRLLRRTASSDSSAARECCYLRKHSILACGGDRGDVCLWKLDVDDWSKTNDLSFLRLEIHGHRVLRVRSCERIFPNYVFSGGRDRQCCVTDVQRSCVENVAVVSRTFIKTRVKGIEVNCVRKNLLVASNTTIHSWDMRAPEGLVGSFQMGGLRRIECTLGPQSVCRENVLVVGSANRLQIFDLRRTETPFCDCESCFVRALTEVDDNRFALASKDAKMAVWEYSGRRIDKEVSLIDGSWGLCFVSPLNAELEVDWRSDDQVEEALQFMLSVCLPRYSVVGLSMCWMSLLVILVDF